MKNERNPDRYAAMLALRLAGASYQAIGTEFGVSGARVYQILAPPKHVREDVLKRASGRCEHCGILVGRSGHVHHGPSETKDGDWFNAAERLLLLCPSCHSAAHIGPHGCRYDGDVETWGGPVFVPSVVREPFEPSP